MTAGVLLEQRLAWFAAGEAALNEVLSMAPDLRVPSLLPGWSRAHVVAHLLGNADALGNLVHWAVTGEATPMYADAQSRSAQIERDAERADEWLLRQAAAASARLAAGLAAMTPDDWQAPVRTALGREVTAAEIPWMRVRETAIHAVDLGIGGIGIGGVGPDACPPALVDALLTDAAATVGAREGCPDLLLAPHDREGTWRLGAVGESPNGPVSVTGSAAELLTWVVGRAPGGRPALPRWL